MSEEGKLNGFRIPLIVNAITMIPIGGVLIGMWSDVQILKTDRADRVSPERLAKIEAILVAGTDNRYRATDAVKDFALRDDRIAELRAEIIVLRQEMDRRRTP